MCHFGPDPTGVRNNDTGEIFPVVNKGLVNLTTYDLGTPKLNELTEPGVYHTQATGGLYT